MFGHRYFGARFFGPRYFGDGGAPSDIPLSIGAGSLWRKRVAEDDQIRDKRWRKRRQQIEKISRLVDGISEELPSDVPEATIIREAEAAVEKAADKLVEDAPPQFFDYRGLAAAVAQAQRAMRDAETALQRYEARKRQELIDQDDEDVLLLL